MSKTKWSLDPTHSEVQFKVKHLVISTVTGSFKNFSAHMETEGEDFSGASAYFEADLASIDTNNNDRDNHLRSADFFEADTFPKLTFQSRSVTKKGTGEYEITGDLTIKNITKEVTLRAEYGGSMTDPYGNHKAGFEVSGKISRKEFGLTWNAVTETGGVVVGDEVRLLLNLQFIKQ